MFPYTSWKTDVWPSHQVFFAWFISRRSPRSTPLLFWLYFIRLYSILNWFSSYKKNGIKSCLILLCLILSDMMLHCITLHYMIWYEYSWNILCICRKAFISTKIEISCHRHHMNDIRTTCAYVYIYIHTHTYMYDITYIENKHTHIYIYIYVNININKYIYIYIYR